MQFTTRKRRQPPTIIIISLIDILIVLLIFLMVTTTFKQQPALKLALPESKQADKPGATDSSMVITIGKEEPYLYLGPRAVTLDKLEEEMKAGAAKNAQRLHPGRHRSACRAVGQSHGCSPGGRDQGGDQHVHQTDRTTVIGRSLQGKAAQDFFLPKRFDQTDLGSTCRCWTFNCPRTDCNPM